MFCELNRKSATATSESTKTVEQKKRDSKRRPLFLKTIYENIICLNKITV